MQKTKNKVIIDTNILISFLLSKQNSKFDSIFAHNKITLVFSSQLLEEFLTVTGRNKFKKFFDLKDVENLILKIRNRGIFVEVTSKVKICRDAKDNFLLALALDSKATHLITGDKDLLVLKKIGKTEIITLADYLKGK
ncbi:MAG: putative toxin-antitoxin system toxin component, PIN family [Bacteroidota bacterium]